MMTDREEPPARQSPVWADIREGRVYQGDKPGASNVRGVAQSSAGSDALPNAPSIFDFEQHHILARRQYLLNSRQPADAQGTACVTRPMLGNRLPDLTGLALSGGGIRSSTFCLGVIEALARAGVLDRLDYLSTVSGGGYSGSSLIASMVEADGGLVFGNYGQREVAADASAPISAEFMVDSLAIGHLRNYSNYLIPNGAWDFFTAATVFCRGLAANAALVLWFPLLAAALTVWFIPSRSDLSRSFLLAQVALVAAFLLFLNWALQRSRRLPRRALSDTTGVALGNHAIMLLLLAVVAFCEFQPIAITFLFDLNDPHTAGPGGFNPFAGLSILIAPVLAADTFFHDHLESVWKLSMGDASQQEAAHGDVYHGF